VRVWDLTTGIETRTLTGHGNGVRAVAVAVLDGRPHAITGSASGAVRVWDLATGTCLTTFHCPAPVEAVAVTDDATVVVGFGHEVATLSLTPLKGRIR
jgi:WD40 repeat protein